MFSLTPDGVLEFNYHRWFPAPGARYLYNYYDLAVRMDEGEEPVGVIRHLIVTDPFFFLYFVLGLEQANRRFVVDAARDVALGPQTMVVDVWAREHFKTTLVTVVRSIQRLLENPERRVGIFSYAKAPAYKILRSIKRTLETNLVLKNFFPEVLYADPEREAPQWSVTEGLLVKRRGNPKEVSLEAHGLIEGMPTGSHFTDRVYDDVETEDLVRTPESMELCKEKFDVSQYLGEEGGTEWVVGTFYDFNGPLQYIANKRHPDGLPMYTVRTKPGTVDGLPNGESVLLSEDRMNVFRANRRKFFCQILLNPSPQGLERLDPLNLIEVEPDQVPQKLVRFLMIDPAGERKSDSRKGDAWAMFVVGVEPYISDLGISDIYILDGLLEEMTENDAARNIIALYKRGGRIRKVAVERVGATLIESHVSNALRAAGHPVSVENETLVLLSPRGREKTQRILDALAWPLTNGRIKVSRALPLSIRERIKMEMQRFPTWHDDALDALAYVYDVVKDYHWGRKPEEGDEKEEKRRSVWDKLREKSQRMARDSWMGS